MFQSEANDVDKEDNLEDLRQALAENLEQKGILRKIRAKVRAEIFHTLEGRRDAAAVLHPPLCNDNLLINELIREYMSYNGYDSALSVFLAESGQPNDKNLKRAFLRGELGIAESRDPPTPAGRLPLLYGIVHALKRWKEGCSMQGKGGAEESGGDDDQGCLTDGPDRVIVSRRDHYLIGDEDDLLATPAGRERRREECDDPGYGTTMGRTDPAPVLFTKTAL